MVTKTVPYTVRAIGCSDIGLVRNDNEDAWIVVPEKNVFVLADGMGGHSAGEVAAQTTVEKYADLVKKQLNSQSFELSTASDILSQLISEVNHTVYQMAQADRELRGMGTTFCCTYFLREGMVHAHVGDSRIYLYRNKNLQQLTEDHSLVQELLDLGEINQRQARESHQRNIITKAIGTEPTIEPTLNICEVEVGDLILMCSDGLTDLLSSDEIQKVLNLTATLEQKVDLFIESANRRGGQDNITVVLLEVESGEKKHLS